MHGPGQPQAGPKEPIAEDLLDVEWAAACATEWLCPSARRPGAPPRERAERAAHWSEDEKIASDLEKPEQLGEDHRISHIVTGAASSDVNGESEPALSSRCLGDWGARA